MCVVHVNFRNAFSFFQPRDGSTADNATVLESQTQNIGRGRPMNFRVLNFHWPPQVLVKIILASPGQCSRRNVRVVHKFNSTKRQWVKKVPGIPASSLY